MTPPNPIKPILFAYLKAKNEKELHTALDYLAPTRAQMRTLIAELRVAKQSTTGLETWCLKRGYTGTETTRGRKERPKKGMSKLYRTQYLKSTDEWILRLPISPLLDNLVGKDKKTSILVLWQEDRIVLTLPENYTLAMRPTRDELAEAPKDAHKKAHKKSKPKQKKLKARKSRGLLSKPPPLPPAGVPVVDVLERNPVVWAMLPEEKKKQIIERQAKLEEEFQLQQEKSAQVSKDLADITKLATTSFDQATSVSVSDEDDEVRALTEAVLSRKI